MLNKDYSNYCEKYDKYYREKIENIINNLTTTALVITVLSSILIYPIICLRLFNLLSNFIIPSLIISVIAIILYKIIIEVSLSFCSYILSDENISELNIIYSDILSDITTFFIMSIIGLLIIYLGHQISIEITNSNIIIDLLLTQLVENLSIIMILYGFSYLIYGFYYSLRIVWFIKSKLSNLKIKARNINN